jgi:2-oxoglutarate dehydrogenase E1 component
MTMKDNTKELSKLMRDTASSFLSAGNAMYVEALYERYLEDPASIAEEWRSYFDTLRGLSSQRDIAHGPIIAAFEELGRQSRATLPQRDNVNPLAFAKKQLAVQALIAAYRMVGSRKARLDPLGLAIAPPLPELEPAFHGLSSADMGTTFSTAGSYFLKDEATLRDIVAALDDTYAGTLGVEFTHVTNPRQRDWLARRIESVRARPQLSAEKRRRILQRLTAAEVVEKYLNTRFPGQQRFSLEGGESLIPALDELIRYGAAKNIRGVVIGMAHRGRLNVLINVVGKPFASVVDEFEGKHAGETGSGDVKYHKGFSSVVQTDAGAVDVALVPNPSHLEIINPVVQGTTRAKAEQLKKDGRGEAIAVEIHGDAAISGQGIVMETLNLTHTPAHGTGGTIHIVTNNQIGFTTSDPREMRSSFYSTDVAKMIEAPVLHVNADDPDAVVAAIQLAVDFRMTFRQSVVIDLVCFRRHGHQEQDTPTITQPLMYRLIAAHPGIRQLYARTLIDEKLLGESDVQHDLETYRQQLDDAWEQRANAAGAASPNAHAVADQPIEDIQPEAETAEHLHALGQAIATVPDGYTLHPLVDKVMASRRDMANGGKPLDWGMGEQLAYASLLSQGISVRLTGQDSARGTFTHRHAVIHDQRKQRSDEGAYMPLESVAADGAQLTIANSILSEAAVLGFEYGYSVAKKDALVIWEAQFGDFANGAQVVMDQFISAGRAKWGQDSSVVMFLPHGQEGQGPEHASARLERYLQLSAEDNMRVVQPTTPAQLFHLLRHQALSPKRRPLVVMTPKSLLRHPRAVSELAELTQGQFQEVLADTSIAEADAANVKTAILASGKLYYELLEHRASTKANEVALIRLEQLYPFPTQRLREALAHYPNLRTVVWSQEEARNQGAWTAIREDLGDAIGQNINLRYAGPPAAASTAAGYASMHAARQREVIRSAFASGDV